MSSPVVSSSTNTNTSTTTTTTTPTKSATDNIKNIDSILSKMSSGTKSLNTQSNNNNNNNQNHRNFLLESFDYNNKLSKSAKNTLNTNYFDTSSYRKSIDSQSLDHNNHHHQQTTTSTSSTNSIKLKLNDQLNKINDSINNIHINRNSINNNNNNSSSSNSDGSNNNKTSSEDVLINLKLKNLRNRPKRRSIENLMETFEEFNKANKFTRLPLVEESISTPTTTPIPTTDTTSATTISDQINSSLTKQQVKKIEIEKKSNFKDLMYKSLKSKTNNNDPIKILNNINNNNNTNSTNNRPKSFYGYPNNFYIQKYLESSYKTIDIIDHLNEFNRNYDKLSKPISDEIDFLDSNSKYLEQNTNKDEKKQKIDNIEEEIVVVVEDNKNNNNNNKLENEVVINNKPAETSNSAYSSLWNDKTIVLNNETDYNRASYHETIATTQPQPPPPPAPPQSQPASSNSYYFTVSEPVSEPTPTKLYNQLDQNQEITSNTNSIGGSLVNIKDDYILDIPKKKSFSDEFYRAKSSLSHHHNSIRSINSQLSKDTIENDSSIISDYVSSSYAVSASATVPSSTNINTNTNLVFEKPKGNSLFLIYLIHDYIFL
jgi:hypothetical protein